MVLYASCREKRREKRVDIKVGEIGYKEFTKKVEKRLDIGY